MTPDKQCSMCKQPLKQSDNPDLYYPHESYPECIMALAKRVEQLESYFPTAEKYRKH